MTGFICLWLYFLFFLFMVDLILLPFPLSFVHVGELYQDTFPNHRLPIHTPGLIKSLLRHQRKLQGKQLWKFSPGVKCRSLMLTWGSWQPTWKWNRPLLGAPHCGSLPESCDFLDDSGCSLELPALSQWHIPKERHPFANPRGDSVATKDSHMNCKALSSTVAIAAPPFIMLTKSFLRTLLQFIYHKAFPP